MADPSHPLDGLPEDSPLSRLITLGPEALTDAELLALVIQDALKKDSDVPTARALLTSYGGLLGLARHLQKGTIPDLPALASARLKAMAELGLRLASVEVRQLAFDGPQALVNYFRARLIQEFQEVVYVLYLDASQQLLGERQVSRGTLEETLLDPKVIFQQALSYPATYLVVGHNHPTAAPEPSDADWAMTVKLAEGARWLGLQLLDHIIISPKGYYSFRENGQL